MGKRLYVGNLPYDTDAAGLTEAFEQDGRKVAQVQIVTDRETGRPRGFAFVEMGNEEDAMAAIEAMDGYELGGRRLRVSVAEDRRPQPARRSAPGRPDAGRAAPARGQFQGRGEGPDRKRRERGRDSDRSQRGGRRRGRSDDDEWGDSRKGRGDWSDEDQW